MAITGGMQDDILRHTHSTHIGINDCIQHATDAVYYPSMKADIKQLVGQCEVFKENEAVQQKEPLLPHAIPARAWEKVGIDIFCN